MQKITLKESLVKCQEYILSNEIIKMALRFRNIGHGIEYNNHKDSFIQLIIKSKSNFDNAIQQNANLKVISDSINTEVYNAENISRLVTIVSSSHDNQRFNLLSDESFINFQIFHKSIVNATQIAEATIKESQQNENAIIFTLVSVDEPVVREIIEVLTILQELVDLVEKIYDEDRENKIYILDKGSNTNIGLETGIKTAQSLFQIFKEVWDWMINRKYYKEKLRNAAFIENLQVIERISEMEKTKALSNEEANRYKELIIKNTDKLLSLNTLPRQLLLEENKMEEDKLLLDYNEVRLLKPGKEESDS